ncbi:ribose-5-phosphate isomerase RpiA [Terrimonas sp. NA20]|uniref:Ribose-5-phosphate isomerase A n=1 Tax=Terrimonas ginsenosidimutans TaxID=2908004 RepID=A0ABS9KR16_9BACT|nr:ribose-5-phosphate isomerase RpiA [Terrimonas ginsenosidimutans]MCG2614747.1 ribose-5-phosphate isomerase RpiA [Terrimonas ginsenosidimutans]
MLSSEEVKKNAGVFAADLVKNGMNFGLGTGSTVYWLIRELGVRVSQGLEIRAVPTSAQTVSLALEAGIPLTDLDQVAQLPIAIDGADEIDPQGQLIKGGGGALLQEKIVAAAAEKMIVIADGSKYVSQLGRFPLPVEVIRFGYKQVMRRLLDAGICRSVKLREKNGTPFITDHQHYILDCQFDHIDDAPAINTFIRNITGVVETGLFVRMASSAIIGHSDGRVETINFR